MKSYKWNILSRETAQSSTLNHAENIIELLLRNRGIKTKKEKEEFLNPNLELITFKSVGIDEAEVKKSLARIKGAIEKNEKIIIYGDYDVDGICGSAILWETLYEFYKNVEPYIPHRVDEGYGLSVKGIENIIEKNSKSPVSLIITVDNGIVANSAVEFANKNNIDVIITDHHVRSDKDPESTSIVHTTKLCGTGVAYLLSKEIAKIFNINRPIPNTKYQIQDTHLELVALATVADLVPLVGANRALLKFGLEKLRQTTRPGLLALFSEAQIKKEQIDTYHIGHIIAPRLNASGRITHALDSLRLICTKDPLRAKNLAVHLGEVNRTRQGFTLESTLHADATVEISEKLIFVSHAEYEEGVIGLIASRLVEKHYKPSIAVSIGEKLSKGSARSISGFNIIEFLRTFEAHMVNAGGHPMAAGFTIETVKLEEFRMALVTKARELILDEHLERQLNIDMNLKFENITLDLYDKLQKLAPFGMGNSQPVFASNARVAAKKTIGRENNHLKLMLEDSGKKIESIYFSGAEASISEGEIISVAYTIDKNVWNGNETLQLKIKDIKPASS